MKVLKVTAWFLFGLVALAIVAGLGVWLFFDPNQLKPHIEQEVEARTGRKLVLEGDIKLSLFPWVGVELGSATLENSPGFKARDFAKIQKVDVRLQLMPLLRREVVTDVIVLEGAQLWLRRRPDGQTNWDDLLGQPSGAKPAEQKPEAPAPKQTSSQTTTVQVAGLSLGGIRISDSRLVWDDRQSGQKLTIRDLNLETGTIAPGQPVALDIDFAIQTSKPKLGGKVNFDGTLDADLKAQRYSLADGLLGLDLKGDDLPGGVFETQVDVVGSVDLARQVAEIKRFSGTVYDVKLDATFKGTQIVDQPSFKGSIRTSEFAPGELIEKLTGTAPETADTSVLKRASVDMDLTAGINSVVVSRLVLVLDDTNLTGTAEVSDFATSAIKFDLTADKLDLDRYLPAPQESQPTATPNSDPKEAPEKRGAAGQKEAKKTAQDPDLEPLRALNLRGTAQIQALSLKNVDFTKAVIGIKAANGQIQIDPIKAALYGGNALVKLGLNVKQKRPLLTADIKVRGIQAEPLLNDLTGEAVLTGRGGLTANLAAAGLSEDEIKRSLDGNLAFAFRNGAINGINVAHIIRQAKAVLKGQPPPPATGPNRTDFAELKASAKAAKGLLVNRDLSLKAPLMRVTGQGKAYLPDDKVDYEAVVAVVNTLEGEGGREFAELEGLEIPVLIKGQLSDPSIQPDYEAIARAEAQRQLEKHGDEIQKQAEDRLKEQLGEDVGGQLGGALKGFINKSE